MTKIILQNEHGSYTVAIDENCLTVEQMFNLFCPLLIVAGFQQANIEDYIVEKAMEITLKDTNDEDLP
jgi:hypothetical protein